MGCFNTEKLWDTFSFPSPDYFDPNSNVLLSLFSPLLAVYNICCVGAPRQHLYLPFIPSFPLRLSPPFFLPKSPRPRRQSINVSPVFYEFHLHRGRHAQTCTETHIHAQLSTLHFLPPGLYWSCCQVSSNPPTQIRAHKPHQQCNSTVDRSWVHVKDACVAFRVWKPPTSQSPLSLSLHGW